MRQEVEANESEIEGVTLSPSPSSEAGQSIILIVLVFVILLAFVGLAVDVGFAFARSSQFAAAVDAAALAGVQDMHLANGDAGRALAQERAGQFLNVNGWPITETLEITSTRGSTSVGSATVQGIPEFTLTVTWQVDLFFLRLLNINGINLTRSGSAAYFAQTDMLTSTGVDRGAIRTSSQFIFGREGCTIEGDPVSPENADSSSPNPYFDVTDGVYHYRIRIPGDYVTDTLTSTVQVELFDPDTYNGNGGNSATVTHSAAYFAAGNPATSTRNCTSSNSGEICVAPTGEDDLIPTYNPLWFVRVDENYGTNCSAIPGALNDPAAMSTNYQLFYYDAANNPVILGNYDANDSGTDLQWVSPSGFTVPDINIVPLDEFGFRYLYLDVEADNGSAKNVWDLRAGPIYPSLPANVNLRNLEIVNNPTVTYTADLDVYVMGRMPLQHFTSGSVRIPTAPIDAIQGGGVIYASIFDFQPNASAPITFTMDTLSMADFATAGTIVAIDPDPDLWQTTCDTSPGTDCNNKWMDPQWRIGIPAGDDIAFFGGILEATYADAGSDAHTWYMAITTGRPLLTR
jgi:Flp pilus assembly protein TadG